MKRERLKQLATNRIKKGYPALESGDFLRPEALEEGAFVELIGDNGSFVGIGYIGEENRTAGWVLTTQQETIDTAFFTRILTEAKHLRQALYVDTQTTAFRVFNGEGDGIGGITIDYYNGYYVLSLYNKGIYRFRNELLSAVFEAFDDAEGIYEKNNFPGNTAKSRLIHGTEAPTPHIVMENGIQYATYLNDGWMTGIFLDQRHVRAAIMNQYGIGKRVLNLFSYTGAFSVSAAMGGAIKTVNIDVANRSKELTAEQFEINGLNPDDHEIRVIDVASYLDYAKKHALTFDLIVIDPPTFARSKKGVWRVEDDYEQVIANSLAVLAEDGILIASTNAWMLSADSFYQMIQAGCDQAQHQVEVLETYGLPEDFPTNLHYPDSQYLKVVVLKNIT